MLNLKITGMANACVDEYAPITLTNVIVLYPTNNKKKKN